MSAQLQRIQGREGGLRVLRDVVAPENRCGVGMRVLRGNRIAAPGENCRLRVVCLDSAVVAEE